MGDSDGDFNLDDAYSVETPEDNKQLYAKWAQSYDDDFLVSHGYVYNEGVAELFARYASPGGAILDVGCGTGAVGIALATHGLAGALDGVDISPEMLDVAAGKTQPDGSPLYRNLIEADLTQTLAIPSNSYTGGVVSAGAFTHGHLGPECLDELLRVSAPGSSAAIGINSAHYVVHGFSDYFDAKHQSGDISKVEIVELAIYDAAAATMEDKDELDTVSYVAIFINRSAS